MRAEHCSPKQALDWRQCSGRPLGRLLAAAQPRHGVLRGGDVARWEAKGWGGEIAKVRQLAHQVCGTRREGCGTGVRRGWGWRGWSLMRGEGWALTPDRGPAFPPYPFAWPCSPVHRPGPVRELMQQTSRSTCTHLHRHQCPGPKGWPGVRLPPGACHAPAWCARCLAEICPWPACCVACVAVEEGVAVALPPSPPLPLLHVQVTMGMANC